MVVYLVALIDYRLWRVGWFVVYCLINSVGFVVLVFACFGVYCLLGEFLLFDFG